MKAFKPTNIFLTLFMAVTLFACKKEETKPTVNPTTGGLIVRAKLPNSTGFINNALIGIATSAENLDNGIYLKEKFTDSNGDANFGQLNPGIYYYDGYVEVSSNKYYGQGQIQIVAGQNLTLTLVLVN